MKLRYNSIIIMTKIIFFGSSEYSVIILKKLLEIKDFKISAVVSKIDKPAGRNQKITPNPVASFAKEHNLNLLQIESFTPEFKSEIRNLKLDLGVCVAFGPPYFDQEMIDLPKYKIINIHPSPLPKYRGATPGPWQIINGETKSTVTFFQIDALPDHGPIITQLPFEITQSETSTTFYQKAFSLASSNIEKILKSYILNPESLQVQDHTRKSYFPKLDKDSAQINWTWDNFKISRFVRALIPWPIAWTYVTNQKGQKLKMKIFSFETAPIEVQIEGKQPTLWPEISKYYSIDKSEF
jgi:methionyl-tRNA formyltransferase